MGSILGGLSLLIGMAAVIYIYSKRRKERRKFNSLSYTDVDEKELIKFLNKYGGNFLSHLFLLGDKQCYWAQEGSVLIVYRKLGKIIVVLGEPVGDPRRMKKAVAEFEMYCKQLGCKTAFYQIDERCCEYFAELGYRFFKLGEEARVYLPDYTLDGKKGAKLRTRRNKFFRKGYQFQVVNPPYSSHFLNELRQVSDSWLDGRKEKGFSVSYFDENYISRFPVAVLTDPHGNIVAFASLADDHGKENTTVTIDLMRHISDSPHGTMDVLFTSIFSWAKEHGYDWCSLGMAPLSNVGTDKCSRLCEKMARVGYLYGNKLYNFKGLREYKGKFAGTWNPKYLVYKGTLLPFLLCHIICLIHRTGAGISHSKKKGVHIRSAS